MASRGRYSQPSDGAVFCAILLLLLAVGFVIKYIWWFVGDEVPFIAIPRHCSGVTVFYVVPLHEFHRHELRSGHQQTRCPEDRRRPGERLELVGCGLRVVDDVVKHVSAAGSVPVRQRLRWPQCIP
ncbi:hypothetical protein [Mycolicibacterium austroafricanum]|uniref:hypothetical protein n=1 Tax=Mycolicibacterium austroafricanum TaxID=39687 RepID=UPI001CA30D76|nr:hypothetical protein [Mycolicibacterium austroafricanum]QZT65866.1 hypothetical protein JN085_14395 [Mycolicibacterium austroafricanum]